MTANPKPSKPETTIIDRLRQPDPTMWAELRAKGLQRVQNLDPYQEMGHEDVVHETLLKIWDGLEAFDSSKGNGSADENVWAWFHRILYRDFIAYLRKERWHMRTDDFDQALNTESDKPPFSQPGALDHALELSRLVELVRRWPHAVQRQAIWLHLIEGHTVRGVAELLDLPTTTVNNWIYRFRKRL